MAWPYDARDQTFAARSQITSDFLNEVQDRIYPIYESKTKIFTIPHQIVGSEWTYNYSGSPPFGRWDPPGATGYYLFFPCEFERDVKILKIQAKIYSNDSGVTTWYLKAYKIDAKFDTAGDAPAWGTAIADITDAGVVASDWDMIETGALTSVIGTDETLMVTVGPNHDALDAIFGVRVTYYPLG